MLIVLALPVIGENLDDPAFGDPTVVTRDHRLELVAQGREPGDLVLDLSKMGLGDVVNLAAGTIRRSRQIQELADGLDLEPKFASVTDEIEAPDVVETVPTLLALRPDRLGHQADLLIVPDGRDLHLGLPRQLTNRQIHGKSLLNL
jgi:hypothetical protein